MMYSIEFSKELIRKLKRTQKKNPKRFEIIIKKIREIKKNPGHYKPLRHDMKNYRRVHIDRPFVLVYKISDKTIIFMDYDHHDNIYRKRTYDREGK